MHEVPENRQRVRDDPVRAATLDVHDKPDTASVVFICRVIKTLLRLAKLFQFRSPLSFTAGDVVPAQFPAPLRVRISLSSEGFAQIRGIRSFARKNPGKSGAKGAKSIPACRGRFNGTRRKWSFLATVTGRDRKNPSEIAGVRDAT
jgi:hypothetical protein